MSVFRRLTTAMAVLVLATPLVAQSGVTRPDTTASLAAVQAPAAPSAVTSERTPLADEAPAWVTGRSIASAKVPQIATAHAFESGATTHNTAMMIVGGAGLLVGAIVGGKAGTVIMVGGGVVGLVGLWRYLK